MYRFNNGSGGVTCDVCDILIDSNLSYQEYIQSYRLAGPRDICWECKEKQLAEGSKKPIDNPVA